MDETAKTTDGTAPLAAPDPERVCEALRCVSCGYPVQGLMREGNCPECGTAVAVSLNPDLLVNAPRWWLWRQRVGQLCLLIAAVLFLPAVGVILVIDLDMLMEAVGRLTLMDLSPDLMLWRGLDQWPLLGPVVLVGAVLGVLLFLVGQALTAWPEGRRTYDQKTRVDRMLFSVQWYLVCSFTFISVLESVSFTLLLLFPILLTVSFGVVMVGWYRYTGHQMQRAWPAAWDRRDRVILGVAVGLLLLALTPHCIQLAYHAATMDSWKAPMVLEGFWLYLGLIRLVCYPALLILILALYQAQSAFGHALRVAGESET